MWTSNDRLRVNLRKLPDSPPRIINESAMAAELEEMNRRDKIINDIHSRSDKRVRRLMDAAKKQAEKDAKDYIENLRFPVIYRADMYLGGADYFKFLNRIVNKVTEAYLQNAERPRPNEDLMLMIDGIAAITERITTNRNLYRTHLMRGNAEQAAEALQNMLNAQNELKNAALNARPSCQSEYQKIAFRAVNKVRSELEAILKKRNIRSIALTCDRVGNTQINRKLRIRFQNEVILDAPDYADPDGEEGDELEDYCINFGIFDIEIPLQAMANGEVKGVRLRPGGNNKLIYWNDGTIYYHPHAKSNSTCWGDAKAPLKNALVRCDLNDMTDIVWSMVRTYNRESPYIALREYERLHEEHSSPPVCAACGEEVGASGVRLVDDRFAHAQCAAYINWMGGHVLPEDVMIMPGFEAIPQIRSFDSYLAVVAHEETKEVRQLLVLNSACSRSEFVDYLPEGCIIVPLNDWNYYATHDGDRPQLKQWTIEEATQAINIEAMAQSMLIQPETETVSG